MIYHGRLSSKTKLWILISAARQADIPVKYSRVIVGNKRRYDLYLANQGDSVRLRDLTPGIECVTVGYDDGNRRGDS